MVAASGMAENIRTVYQEPSGTVWAASAMGSLYQVHGHTLVPAVLPAPLKGVKVRNVYRERSGALWIGTEGDGAFRVAKNALKQYRWRDGMPNDFIRAFAEAPDGTMWIGTDGGLAHITPNQIENIQPTHGLAYFSIRALHFDRHGALWIGTDRGLSRRDARGFVRDAATEALGTEKVWAIHEDPDGAIWLGTRGGGLFRVKDGKVARFTTRNGLASNEIFQLLQDRGGNLWMSGPNGMISTTSCWPLPSAVFSICVLDTITGSVTSRITRVLLTPDSPARNDLTRPTGVAVGCAGRRSFVSSTSTFNQGSAGYSAPTAQVFSSPMAFACSNALYRLTAAHGAFS
jgi:ligand-binding sensor domain-containing protein